MPRKPFWAVVLVLTIFVLTIFVLTIVGLLPGAYADEGGAQGTRVATGQRITPAAAPGSQVLRLHSDLRSDTSADASNAVTLGIPNRLCWNR